MQVVINNKSHLETAIRSFRKKTQREGIIKEARLRKAFEKPSIKRKRKEEESIVKTKKMRRKGYSG
ncbi:MAG: small subunit ribosomal protein S21 [Lentimonas sp.]|jgi:small subunit ribosomal protein S21